MQRTKYMPPSQFLIHRETNDKCQVKGWHIMEGKGDDCQRGEDMTLLFPGGGSRDIATW